MDSGYLDIPDESIPHAGGRDIPSVTWDTAGKMRCILKVYSH